MDKKELKSKIKSAVNFALIQKYHEETNVIPAPFIKKFRLGNWNVRYEHKSNKEFWGRFGGGWNWSLGIKFSPSTIVIDLLVSSLIFNRIKKCPAS